MPEALFVAAGGGGDVIAAAVVANALGLEREDVLIATLAWERLMIDPIPGPRSVIDFIGLGRLGSLNSEILPTTAAVAPSRSTLPRLRSELGHRLALLDPYGGAEGLAEQVADLVTILDGSRSVFLVDVGGDVLARGSEPGLLSPLADALTLAACAKVDSSIELLLAGPGLDGELTPTEVHDRLQAVGGHQLITLSQASTDQALRILEWYPSEATSLLVAASRGIEGVAEIRDAGIQVPLTPAGSVVWHVPAATAAEDSLARLLSPTGSLNEAEEALLEVIGRTELQYERQKAGLVPRRGTDTARVDRGLADAIASFEATAAQRGSDYTTFRHIAEGVKAPTALTSVRSWLIARDPNRHAPPLWRVHDGDYSRILRS